MQRELTPTHIIFRVAQERSVRADLGVPDLKETVTLGHGIAVQQHFLRRPHRPFASRIHRIIETRHKTRIVKIAAVQHGHRRIVRLLACD